MLSHHNQDQWITSLTRRDSEHELAGLSGVEEETLGAAADTDGSRQLGSSWHAVTQTAGVMDLELSPEPIHANESKVCGDKNRASKKGTGLWWAVTIVGGGDVKALQQMTSLGRKGMWHRVSQQGMRSSPP